MVNENAPSIADMGALLNNRQNNGMFGGDSLWFLIILFLFGMFGGWGGNWGGNGNGGNAYCAGVQQGFDQAAVMNGLNGIQTAMSTGFANAEVSRCNSQANVLQTLNNNQNATTQAMNGLAMNLQNCCCENRAGLADLKYTVATENCADRAAVDSGIRDVIANCNANNQRVIDKICQVESDVIRMNYENRIQTLETANNNLRDQLNEANRQASQTAQTAQILADNARQTVALEQYLNPTAIPAYLVQNPNCCPQQSQACCNRF